MGIWGDGGLEGKERNGGGGSGGEVGGGTACGAIHYCDR